MDRSLRFGSAASDLAPYSDSLSLRLRVSLTLPDTTTRRLIMQKAVHHTVLLHSALNDCKQMVSGSISLGSPPFFSPFPHGTCTLSVIEEYLGLEGGPPFSRKSDQNSNTPRFTGKDRTMGTNLQGYHLLWPDLPTFSQLQFTAPFTNRISSKGA